MKKKTLLLASSILGLALHGQAALVAHYTFDEAEGATLAADALGGTSGLVGSAVVTGLPGISGNAYRFHGATATQADIVDMGNASFLPAIVASGQLSFSAWVNTTDTTGNRNTVVFAGDDTSNFIYSDLGVGAGLAAPDTGAATARNRPAGSVGAQQTGIFSTPVAEPVNDGEWHHLVMTVDLSTSLLSLYVDGALANTQEMGVAAFPNFNNFEIGRLGRSSPVDPYEGLIDDVQIYDHALSPGEVQFLFSNPGMVIPEPGTLALAGLGLLAGLRRRRA